MRDPAVLGEPAVLHRARDENGDGGIKRQHIVRKLGRDELEKDPGRNKPGEQKLHRRFPTPLPDPRRGDGSERRRRPERHPEYGKIVSRRPAMRLLHARDLADQVAADRFDEETLAGAPENGDEPRKHQHQQPGDAGGGTQALEPLPGSVEKRQRPGRERDDHQDHRALEQHAAGERGPEHRREQPAATLLRRAGQIGARHRAKRGNDGEQQHGIGLGEAGLDAQHERAREHQRGKIRGAPRPERERGPIGQEHGADRADQRRQPIEPDRGARIGSAETLGGANGRGLQPIDPDWLLVTDVLLKADVDVVAGLDHLLGRLDEASLVAIHRRNVEEAGQIADQADRQEERDRASVRCDCKIEQHIEPGNPR